MGCPDERLVQDKQTCLSGNTTVSELVDWILNRIPVEQKVFTRAELVDFLLDLRNEFD